MGNERFYFQGDLKTDAVQLPWNIDVSYKLNGVPIEAEELAGASGLVEIDIDAVPNLEASQYYQSNMLLQVATMVNLEDTYSIDAPGAQIQSLGTYKGVVFAALPGEEKNVCDPHGNGQF